MRLLQLPASTQRLVAEGRLSAGHARALLGTPDRALQDQLAQRAVAENLTVRQVEDLVRTLTLTESDSAATGPVPTGDGDRVGAREAGDVSRVPGTSGGAAPTRTLPAAGLLELEQLLGDLFDTTVRISMGRGRGRISIDFADVEDLERIYRVITDEA